MSKDEQNTDMDKVTLYELAFNIIPTLGDDGVSKAFEAVKGLVEKVKVSTLSESAPALLPLKYTMTKTIDAKKQKHNTAYFAWIKFDAEPSSIESLKEDIDHLSSILRYMIIKTEKETNTPSSVVAEALTGKPEEGEIVEKTEDVIEDVVEVVDEEGAIELEAGSDVEIDKAVDDLVGEEKGGLNL